MSGRFEIRETTSYMDSRGGWHEVTITDLVTGIVTKALAKTYEEAEREAWRKLKEMQLTSGLTDCRWRNGYTDGAN